MLKGYIEREMPTWQVTVLDLNVWLFRFLLTGIAQGEITLTPLMEQRMGVKTAAVLPAAHMFTGHDDENFYNNPQLYDLLGHTFLVFTEIFVEILTQECAHWEKTGALSPMLKALVEQIEQTQPEMLGVSMIFSEQLPIGAMLGRYAREQMGRKVFFGGSCSPRAWSTSCSGTPTRPM